MQYRGLIKNTISRFQTSITSKIDSPQEMNKWDTPFYWIRVYSEQLETLKKTKEQSSHLTYSFLVHYGKSRTEINILTYCIEWILRYKIFTYPNKWSRLFFSWTLRSPVMPTTSYNECQLIETRIQS